MAELVATDPQIREYRLHAHVAARGLAARVALQVGQPGMVAEVERALGLLARAELIVLTDGGVRLGIDYEPGRPRSTAKGNGSAQKGGTSELKAMTARSNGKKGGRPPEEQAGLLMPIKGGLGAELSDERRKPKADLDGFMRETQAAAEQRSQREPTAEPSGFVEGTQAEPTEASVGFAAAPRRNPAGSRDAPGLLAAAAKGSDKTLEQQQAAIAAPSPRASRRPDGSRWDTQETQAEPTAEPTAPTDEVKPTVPDCGSATGRADATTLAEAAARQFGFTPQHEAEAPGIMQGYLDAGYAGEQVRTVLREKAGKPATSARMLGKALAARFPETRYGSAPQHHAAPPGQSRSDRPSSDKPLEHHKDLKLLPDWEKFSVELRSSVNHLLRGLDKATAADRQRTARYVWNTAREAFLLVAQLRPEAWSLAGEEPPDAEPASHPPS